MRNGRWVRILTPAALLIAGAALLAYGAVRHRVTVNAEEEVDVPTPPPVIPPFVNRPPGTNRPGGPLPPFMTQPPTPPPRKEKVVRELVEPEYRLVLEATRGGVERLEDGTLMRTYSGAPPSGCPT